MRLPQLPARALVCTQAHENTHACSTCHTAECSGMHATHIHMYGAYLRVPARECVLLRGVEVSKQIHELSSAIYEELMQPFARWIVLELLTAIHRQRAQSGTHVSALCARGMHAHRQMVV